MFCFYPKLEHSCGNVQHCPHLGGAALGTLVQIANHSEQTREDSLRTIRVLEKRNSELLHCVVDLESQLAQAKLELKLERQNRFATGKQRKSGGESSEQDTAVPPTESSAKKRGAPVGHPGWFRPTPAEFDWEIKVPAPKRCPHCKASTRVLANVDPGQHLQEDIVEGVYRVVLYRHPACRCDACDCLVERPGRGELLNSRIGPNLRAKAVYLRNVIGISYRKVPRAIEELFHIRFTPAALIGFESCLADLAQPIVQDIVKKLSSSDGAVHADETYWTLDGERAYYWVHGDEKFIHFQFDTSRAGVVSRNLLGDDFTGTLVTDCYSGYFAHVAGAKQKCLAHIARTARDWQKLTSEGTADYQFFENIREFVSRGCRLHRQRQSGKLTKKKMATEKAWLEARLEYLATCDIEHEKAVTLQGRLLRHYSEWLVFVDDARVPPTNNLAERSLRPMVVLRKITFGHRSEAGAQRMATLMSVSETARRHGHRASDIYFELLTRPPNKVLERLYSGN
ncbi:IS66 family transposase [Neorhodopirellula lusitana]|uniref:IS66 family transposase n=1 Tax=Neorhodopirellula lusitana TaxID=445327 RepID=UPI003851489B